MVHCWYWFILADMDINTLKAALSEAADCEPVLKANQFHFIYIRAHGRFSLERMPFGNDIKNLSTQ